MVSIFISSDPGDRPLVRRLSGLLAERGVIVGGSHDASTDPAVADLVVAIWSSRSVSNDTVFNDAGHAVALGRLFSVNIAGARTPPIFSSQQHYDLSALEEPDFKDLVLAIEEMAGRTAHDAPPASASPMSVQYNHTPRGPLPQPSEHLASVASTNAKSAFAPTAVLLTVFVAVSAVALITAWRFPANTASSPPPSAQASTTPDARAPSLPAPDVHTQQPALAANLQPSAPIDPGGLSGIVSRRADEARPRTRTATSQRQAPMTSAPSLSAPSAARDEDRAFAEARASDTALSYARYLSSFPHGAHAQEAKDRRDIVFASRAQFPVTALEEPSRAFVIQARAQAARAAAAAAIAKATAQNDQETDRLRVVGFSDAAYEGQTRNGVPDGVGRLYYQNGRVYAGAFVRGRPQGFGVLLYENGIRYEGELIAGRPNARGVFWSRDGQLVSATGLFTELISR